MKKINLLYIFLCACFVTNAQIQEEDFNGAAMPSGWSMTTPVSGCSYQFGYNGTMPGSGFSNPASFPSGAALFNDNACGGSNHNIIELEGPAVDMVAANVTSAAIEVVFNHQTFANDGNFLIDVWDGSAWVNVFNVDGDETPSNSGTNQTSIIDVSAHINSAFKVKFIYDDEDSLTWGLGIDDYKLQNTATASIEDLLNLGFSYYPNPIVNNELSLQANENISIVNIYNAIGQRVVAKQPLDFQSKIQMAHLPVGVYIVQVAIGEKEGSFKVIKQ